MQQWKQRYSLPVRFAPRRSGAASTRANSLIIFVLGNFPRRRGGKSLFSWIFALGKEYQSRPPARDCLAEIMEITVIVWEGEGRLWADGGQRGNIDGGDNLRDNIPFYIIYLQPH